MRGGLDYECRNLESAATRSIVTTLLCIFTGPCSRITRVTSEHLAKYICTPWCASLKSQLIPFLFFVNQHSYSYCLVYDEGAHPRAATWLDCPTSRASPITYMTRCSLEKSTTNSRTWKNHGVARGTNPPSYPSQHLKHNPLVALLSYTGHFLPQPPQSYSPPQRPDFSPLNLHGMHLIHSSVYCSATPDGASDVVGDAVRIGYLPLSGPSVIWFGRASCQSLISLSCSDFM